MKSLPYLILFLGASVGVWVLLSFSGVMFNSGNADFWTKSLMWSLLSSLLVMPALMVLYHTTAVQAENET